MRPISLDDGEGGSNDGNRGKDNPGLNYVETSQSLNQIDCVRANGVGDHIALPQLAVCGDQSAGRSSLFLKVSRDTSFPERIESVHSFPPR
ncbi:hypothetical protein BDV33DRAFT_180696 [Aspergillus novoparasiticus]|uniref:Uncharacterized protein n=1 Tax=Aspergillus novoparasiticus TaxID=986946 RepID=A0A5N6EFD9_9EURO|nr:hypothetical protein BDV33DRAFT_180696 [Aspergillus novoparasiticus]